MYIEKLIGLALIIVGALYFKAIAQRKSAKSLAGTWSSNRGYIASVAIIVFGIILLFGLRRALKQ